MTDEPRNSGLEIIGHVPWGTHFCQFYESPQDLLDILVPYFKAGLENNEFCMWVTSEPLGVEAARNALRSVLPDLETYLRRGQLEIIPHTDWYLMGGAFDADRVLDGWVRKLEEARAAGFDGLRLTGNTFWLEPRDWRAFTDYEASVDNVIGRYRMLAVCTYSVDRCGFAEILDVIRNHRFALVRREGRWELVESAERRRAMDALQKSEEKFRSLFESMTEGFALHEIVVDGRGRPVDYRFLDINPAFERLTGLRREEVLGRKVSEVLPGIEPFWIQTYGRVALSGEPVTFERHYPAPLDRTYQTYAYRPAPGQFAVVFMDVTLRKRAENALQESNEELEVTAEELRQQNEELLCVQQALQESEERFRIVASSTPDHLLVQDTGLRYTMVINPQLGLTEEDMIGKTDADFLAKDDADRLTAIKREVLATGKPVHVELPITSPTGAREYFDGFYVPRMGIGGRVDGLIGYFRNVTERKRLEGLLSLRTALTELLSEGGSVAEVAPRMLELMALSLGFVAGELWLVDTDRERLRRVVFWEAPGAGLSQAAAARASLEFAIGESIPGTVWSSGEPYWAADAEALPDRQKVESARKAGLKSFFAFPIRLGAGTLGVVGLAAKEPRPADPGTIQVAKIIGLQFGQFILRKQAEAALATSLGALEAVVNFMPAAVVLIRGSDLRLQLVNPAYHTIAPGKDMVGRTLNELWPETGRDFEALCRRVLESGEPYHAEDQLNMIRRRPDGPLEPAYFSWSLHRVRMPGDEGWGILNTAWETTERVRTGESLRQSERRMQEVLESISDGFWAVDRDWQFVYVNQRAAQNVGYEPAQLIGKDLWEVFPSIAGTAHESAYRKVMQERTPAQFETPGVLTEQVYAISVYPSGTGISVYWHDITEQKKAESLRQALAEQERVRLGAAVEQASEAVVMIDLDGTIRYVNSAFESLNGVARNEAIGRSYYEFLAGRSPAIDGLREAVGKGRPWHGPLTGTVRGRQPVELEVTISAITDPAGTVIGVLVTEKDVTQENALQRQVRQAQKMEALGTLAGGITHDFNNILGAVIINTELALLDLETSHPARRPLPIVLQAANRGKELVKQIITFSRQREWERKPMEVAPAVEEALKFLRATLSKGITIRETIAPACGAIMADPSHIHQIMVNLCQNAALAMQEGPGTLEIRLEPVEIDAMLLTRHPELKAGPYVRLTVSDTGCGIEREHLERIFEPFFTTRGPGLGSGLGLAVVHGIVKSYEGTISVYSEPGKGSVFTVYLPRLEGGGQTEPLVRQPRPMEGRERILIVDDEETQRSSLAQGLKRLGYCVTPRAGGRSALSLFRKDPAAFDIVITDQTMPRMSGLELAAEMVKLRPELPVILCTGFSERVNGSTIGRSGVRAFIMKPFTLQEITRLIREAVEKK